jgi:predicted nucleic acid-binding protein
LVENADFGISGQVLAEFCSVATRSSRAGAPLPAAQIDRWLVLLANYPTVAVDGELVGRGVAISRRFQISYYDAAILAAAERLGAPVLYTEDLNHGQDYGPVKVINPFLPN